MRSSPSSTRRSAPGVSTIVITHPEFPAQSLRSPTSSRWSSAERCWSAASRRRTRASARGSSSTANIRATGPEHNVLSTDLGQAVQPAGRGRPGAVGRPAAGGRLQRRARSIDGRRQHAAASGGAAAVSAAVLVIGAHSADFVWRAGGAIAVATARRRGGEGDRAVLRRARRVGRALEGSRARRSSVSRRSATGRPSARRASRRRFPLPRPRRLSARDRPRARSVGSRRRSASSRPTCSSRTPTPILSTPTIRSHTGRSIGHGAWQPAPASQRL